MYNTSFPLEQNILDKEQYKFNNNELVLKVKKSPLIVRSIMFLFTSLFFLLPLSGICYGLATGGRLHIGLFIGLFVLGLMGFYLLRVSLWNTLGKEILVFSSDQLNYVADYGWFKDGKTQIEIKEKPEFAIRRVGYDDDKKGVLIVFTSHQTLNCVTKMPVDELETLIDDLNKIW